MWVSALDPVVLDLPQNGGRVSTGLRILPFLAVVSPCLAIQRIRKGVKTEAVSINKAFISVECLYECLLS